MSEELKRTVDAKGIRSPTAIDIAPPVYTPRFTIAVDPKGNPITWLERPANPNVGETWLLPDGKLCVFCDDGKWRGVWIMHPTDTLYELPPEEQ